MKFKLTATWQCKLNDSYNREVLYVIGMMRTVETIKTHLVLTCQHCEEEKRLRDVEDLKVESVSA